MRWDDAWKTGQAGERRVREWLMERGLYVVPMTDIQSYRNRAPSLEGASASIVLPDLQVFASQFQGWVEIKTKDRATLYHKLNRWEHGLETRLWHQYLQVEAESGIEGWLCVLEVEPTPRALLQRFSVLDKVKRLYEGSAMPGGRPHYFFPCSAFDTFALDGLREDIPVSAPSAPRSQQDGVRAPQLSFDQSGFGFPELARELGTPPDLRIGPARRRP